MKVPILLRTQLKDHQINIFNLDADQTIPFGVVGSNVTLEDGEGRKVRGRKYPWAPQADHGHPVSGPVGHDAQRHEGEEGKRGEAFPRESEGEHSWWISKI